MTHPINHAANGDSLLQPACAGVKQPVSVDWASRAVGAACSDWKAAVVLGPVDEDPERWDGMS